MSLKTNETEFKPRIKLNQNIYVVLTETSSAPTHSNLCRSINM